MKDIKRRWEEEEEIMKGRESVKREGECEVEGEVRGRGREK